MKTLIVEDDFTCRKIMQKFLLPYGDCDIAINGKEAVEAFKEALKNNVTYDLICLDIMMPELDGHGVLKEIRNLELKHAISESRIAKVIMTTALSDSKNFINAYQEKCEGYLIKPIDRNKLHELLIFLKLIPADSKLFPDH